MTVRRRRGGAPARRPYFVSLLHDLGFRARLRVSPPATDYFTVTRAARLAHADGVVGWLPDYMSASSLLEPDVRVRRARRSTFAQRSRRSATPGWTRRSAGRARAAAEDAPAAWAAVDRRVVDLAPAVPYVKRSACTVYVSKRVGNVTYHPTYSTLLDQMWVR